MKEVDSLVLNVSKGSPKQFGDLKRLYVKVPKLRKLLVKKLLAGKLLDRDLGFSGESSGDKIKYWDGVWRKSSYFESMSLALYSYQYQSLTLKEFKIIKKWVNRVTCWEHSDDLSKILATVVEENPDWILGDLRSWNSSRNLWKRRQSLVSLIEYHSKRKHFLSFTTLISFVDPLLEDQEYYVQKGIGWTLREINSVYPEKTSKYIEKNLSRIHPIAYSAATEKLSRAKKHRFNSIRKKLRKEIRKSIKTTVQ